MLQKKPNGGSLSLRLAIASTLGMGIMSAASAQNAPASERREVETVIVTGSFIRGTPEDAAVPVDVLSAEDLETQGSPTVVQLVKTITASQSALGESNRYNGGAGTATINLRGFGAARTLALMNGRRLAESPLAAFQGGGANLNFIPQAAVGRIELLKDGAAATYGSDAIGGVVNFITRTDLDGLELDAEYSYIADSDGDYQGSIAWGSRFERGNILFAGTYRHRSRLDIRDRDWALAPYDDANYGGWTGAGNPGFYVNATSGATLFRDNGCAELGGQLTDAATAPTTSTALTSTCRFQFSTFNDLVNEEDHYQAYAELNYDLTEDVTLHAEVAYALDDVPMQRLSPANLTAQYPSPISRGGTSGSLGTPFGLNQSVRYNVPNYHPGLADLRAVCAPPLTADMCAGMNAAAGVDISPLGWRAIAHAGHPTNRDKGDHQTVENTGIRGSFGLSGDIGGVHWDTALTAMRANAEVNTNDLVVSRLQLALNGFGSLKGGAPCTAARVPANAGRADLGCYFFNPFTNSVAVSAVNGQANPYYRGNANPAVINNPQLVEWLYGNYTNESKNDIAVFDAVLSGEMPVKLWGDDNVGWAAGAQVRYNRFEAEYGDLFNTAVNPCVDSVDDGTPGCANPAGPLIFFGSDLNFKDDREVYAVFAETRVPVTNTFDVSLAVRFEEYGGNVGSTTDPKLSVRWQALDWLALRGSASTTFRAPVLPTLDSGCATGVVQISGQYRAQETCGNELLKPETADTFNVGVLFSPGGFTASIDYFLFKFEGELTLESSSRMVTTLFADPTRCTSPEYAPLRERMSFANDVCSAANLLRVSRYNLNGPDTETSGFDVRLQYDFDEMFGGAVTIGAEGTYLEKYERGEFSLLKNGNIVIAPAEDRAGRHDLITEFFSYPRIRGNAFLAYSMGPVTVRWQTRYTEGTEAAFGTSTSEWVPNGAGGYTRELIGKLDDYIQHDLIVRAQLPWDTIVTGSVQNLLDEDPVDAPSQFNYDYTNGNPLGRVFEVALKKKF